MLAVRRQAKRGGRSETVSVKPFLKFACYLSLLMILLAQIIFEATMKNCSQ